MKTRWIVVTLTLLFLGVVIARFTELEQLQQTLQQGQWSLILVALLSQTVYFVVFTASYQAAFATLDIETRTRDLLPVTLGSLFLNLVLPAANAGGTAFFAQQLARRGKPAARAATGVLLQLIADLVAFIFVLIPGLLYLSYEHDLKSYEIVAAILLSLLIAGLSSILILGVWRPGWLRKLLDFIQTTINYISGKLRRGAVFAGDWAQTNSEEFNRAAFAVSSHPGRVIRTIAIGLLAHLLDLATLYILFRAFHQPIGPGTLVSGYAMGILFWIVSITPQGIGVVEGVMALTFASLGITGAIATTVVLAFRGMTFWIPMFAGFFVVQRLQSFDPSQRTLTEIWSVRVAAILVAVMGAVNVFSAVTPSLADRLAILRQYSPLDVRHGGHLTAALSGFALLMLAHNLARRKRVAWDLTLIVLGISIVSHLVKGLDVEEALLAGALLVMLWFMRGRFQVRSDAPSVQQGLRVLVGAFLFTLTYGILGFFLLDRHYSVSFGFWAAARQTVVMFTQFYDPGLVPITRFGRFFADSIYSVGAGTFIYAGLMLLRPIFIREPATKGERLRAQEIVEQYGHSSLARMLLFEDKHYFFSLGGSVIGYALAGRTAVALGDPIGPKEDLLSTVRAFSDLCQRNDWLPVFYQTLPESLELYRSAGFDALCIGNEAIVCLESFTLKGKAGKHLRPVVHTLTNAGYKFIVHQPVIPNNILEELRSISSEWLTMMHGSEKRFSLGWFEDDYIRNSPIAAVHTSEGWISAFANVVTEYQRNEITIDLMRRRKDIDHGTMEFLFISLFEWARTMGYETFNLGLSALSGVGEQANDPAIERIMHFIYKHINQFYSFKGLHAFKEKFQPEWSPRYLIYPSAANVVQAWLAVIQANSGNDNFRVGYVKKQKQDTGLPNVARDPPRWLPSSKL